MTLRTGPGGLPRAAPALMALTSAGAAKARCRPLQRFAGGSRRIAA